ncbi:MAG: hypothetical protein ACD_9C00280G0001 [uncultured bacterium]|nr:MAG: hypothetical protein ACD_9C00280G0001 [uncultured bacterium]
MKLVSLFQAIMAITSLMFLVSAWMKFLRREQRQTFFKLFTNNIVWLGILIFSLFPQSTHNISQKLGFGESLNTFIFIGFVIVFMILFKIITMIERIEKNISEIVRKEALDKITEKN